MDDETGPSRFVYWVIGLLAIALILGVSSWLYLRSGSPQTVKEQTPAAAETATDPVETVGDEITAALSELDIDLASIDEDLASTDDDVPSL